MGRPAPRLPADDIREYNMTLADWRPGTITLLKENRTPPGAVVVSKNLFQTQDGVWRPKFGSRFYTQAMPSFRKGAAVVTTNLIPNPSLETDATGWAAVGSATIAQDATEHYVGTKSLKITKSGTATEGATSPNTANVAANTYHTGQLRIKAPLGLSMTFALLHNSVVVGSVVVVGTGAWQLATITAKSGAGSHALALKLTWAVTGNVFVDAAMVTTGANVVTYFDGATADTDSTDYAWTGTAHLSTATKSVYEYGPYDIDGAFEVANPDNSTGILEVAGGKLYYSENGGAKTEITITNGTLTTGKKCFFKQIRGFVYITNYYDPMIRYDTDAQDAAGYTEIDTPVGATLAITGLASGPYKAYYVIVATNEVGVTVGSTEASIDVNKKRDEWPPNNTDTNTTNFVTVTLTRVTGASRYSIFYSDTSGKELYLDSVPDPGSGTTFAYIDRGQVAVNEFVELPNDNTTGGPILGPTELSGNRIWAIQQDGAVVWSGTGQYTGTFSPFYGGGYVYLEKGGRERPTCVVHYRDGKGISMATVFTTDPEGIGSTWQVTLDVVTIGTTSFIVPNPVKIVGSIGCSSPRGWAKVGDDIVIGNRRGAFSLGNAPSLVNVLSTRELSANTRPSWRALSGVGMANHASYFYDAKLLWALPAASAENSEIWVRDFELRNWQKAWEGVAIASFLEYTDSNGNTRLLGVPVSGAQLIEFSPDIRGDIGEAFDTLLKTGRLPIDKNHNRFAQIDNVFVEVGDLRGTLSIDIYGYDYKKGFIFLKNLTITGGSGSSKPWGHRWSTAQHSASTGVATFVASSVYRRYKRINKLINSLQFVVTTTGIGDYFELLEISAEGYLVKVDPPRIWKLGSTGRNTTPDVLPANALTDEDGSPITDESGNVILA